MKCKSRQTEEQIIPMTKPCAMASFMAHPLMPNWTAYIQKLSTISKEAAGIVDPLAISS